MKKTEDINNLLAKHFAEEVLTDAQQLELTAWIAANQQEYSRLEKLLSQQLNEQGTYFDSAKAWKQIEPALKEHHSSRRLFYRIAAAAAVVILVVGIAILWRQSNDTPALQLANHTAAKDTVNLPDGSMVVLYPGANLAYKGDENSGNRQVRLSGKAFFHVERNIHRPFIIQAHDTKVEVLGTSFLVDASKPEKGAVYVKSGLVKVSLGDKNVLLKASQQVEITPASMVKSEMNDAEQFFAETPPTLKFNNTPIAQVTQKLESYFHVEIELGKGIEINRITTQIKLVKLSDILVELSYLCGCEYQKIADSHYKLYYR